MNDKELTELENPDNWDWEKTEKKDGRRGRRTIVSVGFLRSDFKKVSRIAERFGWNVSAFVRDATLAKIAEVEAVSTGPLSLSEPRTSALPLAPSTRYRFQKVEGLG